MSKVPFLSFLHAQSAEVEQECPLREGKFTIYDRMIAYNSMT
jgi:hypothetical protein